MVTHGNSKQESETPAPGKHPHPLAWVLSGALSLGSLALVAFHRQWLFDALSLIATADARWLAAAVVLEAASFLLSSRVLGVALRALGYRLGVLRLWALAVAAIVLSQSVPAGAVGSYTLITRQLTRRGVALGHAALVATLESLSYLGAMLLVLAFSVGYLLDHTLSGGSGTSSLGAPLLAGAVALGLIALVLVVLTRPAAGLRRGLLTLQRLLPPQVRPRDAEAWAARLVRELGSGRELLRTRWRAIGVLVLLQLGALLGHSLALACVLRSLGATLPLSGVIATYGIELITSTFNLLPGGGGTVETALVATLTQLGGGAEAVPAVVLFRLFNYWALLPVAALSALWLRHGERAGTALSAHTETP